MGSLETKSTYQNSLFKEFRVRLVIAGKVVFVCFCQNLRDSGLVANYVSK
jgi:hypothetical protein